MDRGNSRNEISTRSATPYAALLGMLADDSAQGLVEYSIIVALVAMVAVATLKTLGRRATNGLGSATNGFS